MYASLSTALSALNAQSTAIDVVGNNLANLNTTGFKASTVAFHDLMAESLGAAMGETQVGFGVGRPITLRAFSQGAIQTTTSPLDCAIQGDGFLIVKDPSGATLYTRDGNLQVDKDGNLMTSTGQKVQGWTGVGGTVNTNAPLGDITIPVGTLKSPIATTNFSLDMNLDAAAIAGPPADHFTTSIDVYDSLGTGHTLTVTFTRDTAANSWTYSTTATDATVTMTPANGTLAFDDSGHLIKPGPTDPQPTLALTKLSDGAADMNLTWNLFDGTTSRLTQFAQKSAVSANAQDGAASAQLIKVALGNGGVVVAQYSNGQQSVVGQLAMASIRNPESLISVGNNDFQLTALSAAPAIGLPSTGQRGALLGGALESSNVDIAREFTNLIVLQRGYQANSKVITTVDDISQQTVNLKRD